MEKYNIPVINWVRFEGDLDFFFGAGGIDWESSGFSIPLVKEAVKSGFQWTDDSGNLISVFPVSSEVEFNSRFADIMTRCPSLCRIVTEEEAVSERNEAKAAADIKAKEEADTPSQDDIYKAQQLLLLTEISNKLGGING